VRRSKGMCGIRKSCDGVKVNKDKIYNFYRVYKC
jgi:hypothetical protein